MGFGWSIRRWPRPAGRIVGPLLLSHVLLLGGGCVLVAGLLEGRPLWSWSGGLLFSAGTAVELALISWSISRTREAAAARGNQREPGPRRWLCPQCAWTGTAGAGAVCPRCGRPMGWAP